MTRTMTFAGKSLTDFACYWDASQVFRKPAKRVVNYAIPAHNGDYLVNDRTFDNVTIMFNCYIKDNYETNYSDLVNYLNSFDTYQKLETSAEPNVYRMAMLHASIEPDTGQFLKDGQFTLEFDCMPQEFLNSGDTPVAISGNTTTNTGNPLTVNNTGGAIVGAKLTVNLEPTQSTSGSKPWAITGKTGVSMNVTAGGVTDTYSVQFHTGKNLLNYDAWMTDGVTGGSATWSNYGAVLTSTSADCYTNYQPSTFPTTARIAVSQGDVLIMTWELTGSASGNVFIFGNGSTSSMASTSASDRMLTYTVPSGVTYVTYRVGVTGNGNTLTYKNVMIRKQGTDGSFETYGTSGLSTIYGGEMDMQTGTLKVTMDVIEYYTGQTIGTPWKSSMDNYSQYGTPTTGAKVVYTLANPIYYYFDVNEAKLKSGSNTITTDAKNVTIKYKSSTTLANPTPMEAQPLITLSSAGSLYLNGELIVSAAGGTYPMYIDCETMDAYAIVGGERVNMNGYVNMSDDLIKLKAGNNYVAGTASATVTPRWWRL